MALIHFLKPKNILEEGGRTGVPVQQDEGEPEKLCPNCRKSIPLSRLWANQLVCPCGYHFRMRARQRIRMTADKNSFCELFQDLKSENPLHFPGYREKLDTVRAACSEEEAVICGTARIGRQDCCLFAMDPAFMMGSMGTAVGEKITSLFEYAAQHRLPVVGFTVSGGARMQEGLLSLMQMAKTSAAVKRHSDAGLLYIAVQHRLPVVGFTVSGGARMQEGLLSLMQMAKTSAAVKRHSDAGLLYIAVLTDPTTGGVTASFAMEADITLAEPGALIGFAGSRVIEQTTRKSLPKDFQRAEFVLEHGFIDSIAARPQQRRLLSELLKMHKGGQIYERDSL